MNRKEKLAKQKVFAEMMFHEKYGGNAEKICEETGVEKEEFEKWLDEEGFKKLFEKAAKKSNYREIAVVWKSLIDLCRGGNIQAIKFYFEMKEKCGEEINPKAESLVQIIDDIPEKRGEYD